MQKISASTKSQFPPVVSERKITIPNGIRESITINKPREEVYTFWRNSSNLPSFMVDLSQVETLSDTYSRWTSQLPLEQKVQWDVQIIADKKNELITWKSIEGAKIQQRGTVIFRTATGGRGTVVSLSIHDSTSDTRMAELAFRLIGEDLRTLLLKSLHRLRAQLEVGEIPTISGQSSGRDPSEKDFLS